MQHIYTIQFANSPTAFPNKSYLENLLEDLGNLGKIENKKITANAVNLSLTTHASEADLREIFSFFLKPEQLTITVLGGTVAGKVTAESKPGYCVVDGPSPYRTEFE